MSKWTEAELAAIDPAASGRDGWRLFRQATNSDKSFDAWEVKRRRLAGDLDKVPIQRATGPLGIPQEYVGFNIGYFDIETTFSTQPIVLYAAIADAFGNVSQFEKGDDITDDRDLVARYADALRQYDIVVSWNGKLFDQPVLQARLAFHNLPRLDLNMHVDLMYYATGQFMRMGRKSLQSVSEYFEVQNQKTPLRVRQWDGAMAGKPEEYAKIKEHCDADVLVLRDVFPVLKRHIRNIHRAG